jgi:thiosulfate dehydrogenase [quinone] large subunit
MTETAAATRATQVEEVTIFVRLFTALRIFTGLVFLTNGLAKVLNAGSFDLGFFSFTLITNASAKGILTNAAAKTGIRPLGAFYQHAVLPAWGFWGVFLTLAELAVGIGLLLGIASRLAALGGLMLIAPIWIMLWHTHLYLWEYPAEDLFPLVLLAIAPAGRHLGMDRRLVGRFGRRWPF